MCWRRLPPGPNDQIPADQIPADQILAGDRLFAFGKVEAIQDLLRQEPTPS